MNEFEGGSKTKAIIICLKYEISRWLVKTVKNIFGIKPRHIRFNLRHRYPVWYAKKIVIDERLGITHGRPSWFYVGYDRNNTDPLTNYYLQYIEDKVQKSASILITGCGCGISSFHLADSGFQNIEGRDLLDKCIRVANRLKERFSYHQVQFFVDDCFNPNLNKKYDLIVAMHWVMSAWHGNYGNVPVDDPFNWAVRERLLTEFLNVYKEHLNKEGMMIIELTDGVADYREPFDHPDGENSKNIYPVRHTPEQVSTCANEVGMEVVEKRLSISYGHQPRTAYILKKR